MSRELMTEDAPLAARQRILAVAGQLFYREGYRAIGVDRVIAEAEVAKATFYKHFRSKDALIIACIAGAEAATAQNAPAADGPTPLTDYAMAMIATAGRPQCLGCAYQISAGEFGDLGHPVHQAAMQVKERVLADLTSRAARQGFAEPKLRAEMVFLLVEGVWAARRMFGPAAPLDAARHAVQRLTTVE